MLMNLYKSFPEYLENHISEQIHTDNYSKLKAFSWFLDEDGEGIDVCIQFIFSHKFPWVKVTIKLNEGQVLNQVFTDHEEYRFPDVLSMSDFYSFFGGD